MKSFFAALVLFVATSAPAAFIELQNATELNDLVKNSTVPVIVQFEAYWCGPCQSLKSTFNKVAASYSDSQVRLAHIDAYVNTTLQKYIQGGYPTVRTFMNGSLGTKSFSGSKSESALKSFINSVIRNDEDAMEPNFEVAPICPLN